MAIYAMMVQDQRRTIGLGRTNRRRVGALVRESLKDRRQFRIDSKTFRSRREIGIPMALWELCGKRLCLGFVVELLNCGTLCTEVDEEFRESFGGEPLQ